MLFFFLHYEWLTALAAIRRKVDKSGLNNKRNTTFDRLELLLYWGVLSKTGLIKLRVFSRTCKTSDSGVELATCLLLALDHDTWCFIYHNRSIHFLHIPRYIDSPFVSNFRNRIGYRGKSIRCFCNSSLF